VFCTSTLLSLTTKAKEEHECAEEALTKRCGMGQMKPQLALHLIIMLKQSSLKNYIPNLNDSYNERDFAI